MGRRKTIFYGRRLEERFEIALGFPDYERADNILSEKDYVPPKIDWVKVANRIDQEIPRSAKRKIDFEFEAELGFRVQKAITKQLSGEIPEDEMSEADFLKKAEKIESIAQRLTEEINELAELGTRLIVRPKPRDGLTSAEEPSQYYCQTTGRNFAPSAECFFDYYSFRKLLDYFANFSSQNSNFHSFIGDRFDRMPDYSWYETFVRRVVLAFWPTNFPMTVTIPTDTNPDYRSPIILVLEELREQFNQLSLSNPDFADMHEEWTYRQHTHLVQKLREEFEQSGIFWVQNSLRRFNAEQTAFAEKNI